MAISTLSRLNSLDDNQHFVVRGVAVLKPLVMSKCRNQSVPVDEFLQLREQHSQ